MVSFETKGCILLSGGRIEEGLSYMEKAAAEDTGLHYIINLAQMLMYAKGGHQRAKAVLQSIQDKAPTEGLLYICYRLAQSMIAVEQNRAKDGRAILQEVQEQLKEVTDSHFMREVLEIIEVCLAVLDAREGRTEQAKARVEPPRSTFPKTGDLTRIRALMEEVLGLESSAAE